MLEQQRRCSTHFRVDATDVARRAVRQGHGGARGSRVRVSPSVRSRDPAGARGSRTTWLADVGLPAADPPAAARARARHALPHAPSDRGALRVLDAVGRRHERCAPDDRLGDQEPRQLHPVGRAQGHPAGQLRRVATVHAGADQLRAHARDPRRLRLRAVRLGRSSRCVRSRRRHDDAARAARNRRLRAADDHCRIYTVRCLRSLVRRVLRCRSAGLHRRRERRCRAARGWTRRRRRCTR